MSKPKTQAQRRQDLFAALEQMRTALNTAAYLQGCRAAKPDVHDTGTVRARESAAYSAAFRAQGKCIAIHNAAVRAARSKA